MKGEIDAAVHHQGEMNVIHGVVHLQGGTNVIRGVVEVQAKIGKEDADLDLLLNGNMTTMTQDPDLDLQDLNPLNLNPQDLTADQNLPYLKDLGTVIIITTTTMTTITTTTNTTTIIITMKKSR